MTSLRTAVRDTKLAEQLVEVPTIVSYSLLQLVMEQNVDFPVPRRGGPVSGLQGFSSGQSSTASSHFPAGVEERPPQFSSRHKPRRAQQRHVSNLVQELDNPTSTSN